MTYIALAVVLLAIAGYMLLVPGGMIEGKHGGKPIPSDYERVRRPVAVGIILLFLLLSVVLSIASVSPGHVGFKIAFSQVVKSNLEQGVHLVEPWVELGTMEVRRDTVDFSDDPKVGSRSNPVNGPAVRVTAGDQTPLAIDISGPYAIRGRTAWLLYKLIGRTDGVIEAKLLETSFRAAVSEVATTRPWAEIATVGRAKFAADVLEAYKKRVRNDLMDVGFTKTDADGAFVFMEPQIRDVKVPDKIRNAVAERMATTELKKRQAELNEIEQDKRTRVGIQGEAIAGLLKIMPKGTSAGDVAALLTAMAQGQTALAVTKAVEAGTVQTMVISGSAPVAASSATGR